jgi:hypothetical protein
LRRIHELGVVLESSWKVVRGSGVIDEVVGRLELIVLLGDCDDGIFLLFDNFEVGLEEAFLIAAVVVLHIQCNINYEICIAIIGQWSFEGYFASAWLSKGGRGSSETE